MNTELALEQTKVYKDNNSLANPLAIAILDRTIRDCVYLRRKEIKSFVSLKETSTNTKLIILNKEKWQMTQFLKSEFFASLCELIGQDDYLMKTNILKILKNNEAAQSAAKELGMKFVVSIFLVIIFTFLPAHNVLAQAFPPLSLFESLPTTPVIEVTTLDSVKSIKIPVKCKGRTIMYRIATYTYLTPSGAKVSYPFLVTGSDKAKHPITAKIKLYGNKLMIFAPFISVAGSIAQILSVFKI